MGVTFCLSLDIIQRIQERMKTFCGNLKLLLVSFIAITSINSVSAYYKNLNCPDGLKIKITLDTILEEVSDRADPQYDTEVTKRFVVPMAAIEPDRMLHWLPPSGQQSW